MSLTTIKGTVFEPITLRHGDIVRIGESLYKYQGTLFSGEDEQYVFININGYATSFTQDPVVHHATNAEILEYKLCQAPKRVLSAS